MIPIAPPENGEEKLDRITGGGEGPPARPPCQDGRFDLSTRDGIEKAYNDLADLVMEDQSDPKKAALLKNIFGGAKAALDAKLKDKPEEHTNEATGGTDASKLPARGPFAVRVFDGGRS